MIKNTQQKTEATGGVLAFWKEWNINVWAIFFLTVYVIFVIKWVTYKEIDNNLFFGIYSILVSFYLLSRFALAYFYDPQVGTAIAKSKGGTFQPTMSFGVPSKNEGVNIRETILRIAKTDYPKEKFDIIAINDGSDDNTLEEMLAAKKEAKKIGVKVIVVDWKINRGKREGMAECVRLSDKDILVFIDSDSFVKPDTAWHLVKYFVDPMVGAVAGHAYVANEHKNILTKMQAVRYYVAFKAYKAAEALYGAVTCCSGCCSAYRRSMLLEVIDPWLKQRFLGVLCTYGDDRSLTNALLKLGHKALFSPDAIAYTFVPDTFKVFLRQQFRWKKSWFRENLLASTFIWKKHPIMSISFYVGFLLPLFAPIVLGRALIWYPLTTHQFPWYYVVGLLLMVVAYGLYYYVFTKDQKWLYGVLAGTFYAIILVWQLPWAILNLRDAKWGTR